MNIIVSGHNGDTGIVLLEALKANGHSCATYKNDIQIKGINRLVHTAAKHPIAIADEIISSNILYLQSIVEKFMLSNDSDFVFLSSVSVYGNTESSTLNEQVSVCPTNLYETSKIFGEQYLLNKGIRGVSLRLPGVLEVNKCNNFMGRLLKTLENDGLVEISNADSLFNGYVDPFDIADFVSSSPKFSLMQPVNFAVQAELTLRDTVYLLRELCNSKSVINEVPAQGEMKIYSTKLLSEEFGFNVSRPADCLERWLKRRRKIN